MSAAHADSRVRIYERNAELVSRELFGDEVDVIYAVADSRGFGWFDSGKFFRLPCHGAGGFVSQNKAPRGKGGNGALHAYHRDLFLTRVSWRGRTVEHNNFCTHNGVLDVIQNSPEHSTNIKCARARAFCRSHHTALPHSLSSFWYR